MFKRFRQGESVTRRRPGLGLGLWIARAIVSRHGGTVTVESPGAGLGSTFTVSLPMMVTETQPPQE